MSEPQWKRTERTSRNKIQSSVFRSNTSLLTCAGIRLGAPSCLCRMCLTIEHPQRDAPYRLIRRTWLNSAHSSTIVMASHT